MRLPLIGGSYTARSIIANAQRCINLFPEINTKDALVPVTHYQRPGFRPLVSGPSAPVRGLWRASTGQGFAVIGSGVYLVNANWSLQQLGVIQTNSGPVSMADNGVTMVLGDASGSGYECPLAAPALSNIVDSTGIFQGATKWDYIDTFLLWGPVSPGQTPGQFGSSLSNEVSFDATYVAGKTDYPDPLVTLVVNNHLILLLGAVKSEIWYDAGNSLFPFAEVPGAYIEHGCAAPYSAASSDINVYWLGQDLQGQGVVYRQRGYETRRISNHALEYAIRQAVASGATIADAIGYTYQQDGHYFYVLTFPSADMTWAFDEATQEWSQRGWSDANGILHRDRSNCFAFINGTPVVGDWQNGTLYALDPNYYLDAEAPITFLRSFPHVGKAESQSGQPMEVDWKRQRLKGFWADIEVGLCAPMPGEVPAQASLRVSPDRGRTFGNAMIQSLGKPGEYLTQPQWRVPGGPQTIVRDPVFELSYSVNGPAALNGAWIETEVMAS